MVAEGRDEDPMNNVPVPGKGGGLDVYLGIVR